jgi:hypothetical protein
MVAIFARNAGVCKVCKLFRAMFSAFYGSSWSKYTCRNLLDFKSKVKMNNKVRGVGMSRN